MVLHEYGGVEVLYSFSVYVRLHIGEANQPKARMLMVTDAPLHINARQSSPHAHVTLLIGFRNSQAVQLVFQKVNWLIREAMKNNGTLIRIDLTEDPY